MQADVSVLDELVEDYLLQEELTDKVCLLFTCVSMTQMQGFKPSSTHLIRLFRVQMGLLPAHCQPGMLVKRCACLFSVVT